ncbi:MAG TPA: thiamine phosphate synthase [Thermomicrobiales bacterium]|nr:thiamine phosphate synthase [Thermomicrobiales bacterium]
MALFERPHLQYITEVTPLLGSEGFDRIVAAVEGGVDSIQLRERGVSARTMFDIASRLIPIAATHDVAIAINDRIDVAAALDGVGLHLGGHSLPIATAREIAGPRIIGVSTHSLDDARIQAASGADYVTFGHIFATTSHPGEIPAGLATLREVAAVVNVPILAIGGVDRGNIAGVLAAGAAGITVISAIRNAFDPYVATRELRHALDHLPAPGAIA